MSEFDLDIRRLMQKIARLESQIDTLDHRLFKVERYTHTHSGHSPNDIQQLEDIDLIVPDASRALIFNLNKKRRSK
jgi:hypothetical protein